MSQGWIKLHRELIEHPLWQCCTPQQKVILVTLLLMVNHSPRKWMFKGVQYDLQAGQTVTSYENLAHKCGKGVSVQNVRTALNKFESFGFLTRESTNQNTLITIVNWGIYQAVLNEANMPARDQLTNNQQSTNKPLTTNKNDKKSKKEKNKSLFSDIAYKALDWYMEKLKENGITSATMTEQWMNDQLTEIETFYPLIDNDFEILKNGLNWFSNQEFWKNKMANLKSVFKNWNQFEQSKPIKPKSVKNDKLAEQLVNNQQLINRFDQTIINCDDYIFDPKGHLKTQPGYIHKDTKESVLATDYDPITQLKAC